MKKCAELYQNQSRYLLLLTANLQITITLVPQNATCVPRNLLLNQVFLIGITSIGKPTENGNLKGGL